MAEPIPPYSRWVSINDALVAAQSPTWITAINSYRPAPKGRIARSTHSSRGDVIGPEVLSEPSSVPWQKYEVDNAVVFDPAIVTPTYYVADFMARAPNKIDVRMVNEPDIDWQYLVNNPPFDATTVTPIYYVSDFISARRTQIDVRSINQPDTDWQYPVNDTYIQQSVVPPIYNLKYRATEPKRMDMRSIVEPSFAWIWFGVNDIVISYPLSPTQFELRRALTPFVNQPHSAPWIYPNITVAGFDAALWPALQLKSYRMPDGPKLRVFDEPSESWTWRTNDDIIARITPNLWVPKYLARERGKIDVREISEPEGGWIIVPLAPPYVPLDPKLWPAIEQQLNAIRTRSRNELNVITINVPGFGWVTGYIPPVIIATGSHEKRKWRRS